jgi:hypothetical protein
MELTRKELEYFTLHSVDPNPRQPIIRQHHNVELTDHELRMRIIKRIKERKPTSLLRFEYNRRLNQREL